VSGLDQVGVVRRIWDAWARRDSDAALDLYDPAVEAMSGLAVGTPRGGESGTYRGYQGLRRWLLDFSELFDDFVAEPEDFRDAGARVVVRVRMGGRGKRSGAYAELVFWNVYTVVEGRVVRLESFAKEGEALKAAGLEE
jgi:ketosteroid isomerase-like protein